jgi:hypothetical protein
MLVLSCVAGRLVIGDVAPAAARHLLTRCTTDATLHDLTPPHTCCALAVCLQAGWSSSCLKMLPQQQLATCSLAAHLVQGRQCRAHSSTNCCLDSASLAAKGGPGGGLDGAVCRVLVRVGELPFAHPNYRRTCGGNLHHPPAASRLSLAGRMLICVGAALVAVRVPILRL